MHDDGFVLNCSWLDLETIGGELFQSLGSNVVLLPSEELDLSGFEAENCFGGFREIGRAHV